MLIIASKLYDYAKEELQKLLDESNSYINNSVVKPTNFRSVKIIGNRSVSNTVVRTFDSFHFCLGDKPD